MMAVDVTTTPSLTAGEPRPLFEGKFLRRPALWANYDVTPDGCRFVMIKPATPSPTQREVINVVLNWPEDLRRRAGQEPR